MQCGNCQHEIDPDARFCEKCGKALSAATVAVPGAQVRQKTINPNLFIFSFWGGMLACVMGVAIEESAKSVSIVFLVGGITAIIFAWVYQLVSLSRCWYVLQPYGARTTPGRAVGFMFIPFFNFYWPFVAYKGLAEDANALADQNQLPNRISRGLSLAVCIILLIPYLNLLVTPILFSILVYQWAKFHNGIVTLRAVLVGIPDTDRKKGRLYRE